MINKNYTYNKQYNLRNPSILNEELIKLAVYKAFEIDNIREHMTINNYMLIKLKVININDSISILTPTVKFNFWNNWLQYYEHLIFNNNELGIKPEHFRQT